MEQDKFNAVLDYFTSIGITLPTEVKNSIEDVFMETDVVDEVQCYHPEDIGTFEKDLTLFNDVKMGMKGWTKGTTNNVWTYYGEVDFSLSEKIVLLDDNGEELEVISEVNNPMPSRLVDTTDYTVVLYERVTWDSEANEFKRVDALYIYCPKSDNVEENRLEDKYDGIYNQIKEAENGASL